MDQPWRGDDLPSGNWTLTVPPDLPAGLGIGALLCEARSTEVWWAVFLWDGTEATVLSVHQHMETAWPSLAVAYLAWRFVDAQFAEADVKALWEACRGATSPSDLITRAQAWMTQAFGSTGRDPFDGHVMDLASMPTPKTYH